MTIVMRTFNKIRKSGKILSISGNKTNIKRVWKPTRNLKMAATDRSSHAANWWTISVVGNDSVYKNQSSQFVQMLSKHCNKSVFLFSLPHTRKKQYCGCETNSYKYRTEVRISHATTVF